MKAGHVYVGVSVAFCLFGVSWAIMRSMKRLWTVFFAIVGLLGTLALLFVVGLIWGHYREGALPGGAFAILPGMMVSCFAATPHMARINGLGVSRIIAESPSQDTHQKKPQKLSYFVTSFIGEQKDGPSERDLKARFAELFRQEPVVER